MASNIDFLELLKKAIEGNGGIIPVPQARPDPTTTGSVQADPAPMPMRKAAEVDPTVPTAPAAEEEKPNFFQRIFDPATRDERQNFLLPMGAAMMVAGGGSTQPMNFWSAVGQGLAAGQKGSQEYANGALERQKAKSAQAALDAGQQFANDLGKSGGGGEVDPETGYTTGQLMKLHQFYVSQGKLGEANQILEKIQRLQDTAHKKLLVIGDNGEFENAPGAVDAQAESAGAISAAKEATKTTNNQRDYAMYVKQAEAAGETPQDFTTWLRENKKSGASTQTVNLPGEDQNRGEFNKESDKLAAKRLNEYVEAGNTATQMVSDIQTLADLGRQIKTGKGTEVVIGKLGPWAAAVGIEIDGLGAQQAYDAIIARLAPNMRPAGAGATSDFDAKQYLKALPSLGNTPEGNALISDTMQAIAENKIAAADLANQAQRGEITWQEAEKQIRALPNPYTRFKEFQKERNKPKKIMGQSTEAPAETAPAQNAPEAKPAANVPPDSVPVVNSEADLKKYKSGDWVRFGNSKPFQVR